MNLMVQIPKQAFDEMAKQQKKAVQDAHESGYREGFKAGCTEKVQELVARDIVNNENYASGYEMGRKDGLQWAVEACFSATAIALHQIYGFGAIRGERVMRAAEKLIIGCLDVNDLCDQATRETGMKMKFFDEEGPGLPRLEWEDIA